MLAGGMRRAGVLAAAGIHALERMVDRVAEDHANARLLAQGLARVTGIEIDPEPPQTNIVFFRVAESSLSLNHFLAALENEGVRVSELGKGWIRAVTHYGVNQGDVKFAVAAVRRVLDNSAASPVPA